MIFPIKSVHGMHLCIEAIVSHMVLHFAHLKGRGSADFDASAKIMGMVTSCREQWYSVHTPAHTHTHHDA